MHRTVGLGSLVDPAVAGVLALLSALTGHLWRRRVEQRAELDKIRTEALEESTKRVEAVMTLMSSVADVKAEIAYLQGVNAGRHRGGRK